MKLPLEIREMIYSRLVIPEERTFRSKSIQRENKYQNDEYEEGGMPPRPTQPPARAFYCLSILRTSSIICNEALELMYKNVIYEFEARDNVINIMGNCAIVVHDAKDDIALTRLRQFHLIISAYNLHIDDTGIITFGIAHFFRHIQSILATRADGIKLKVTFTFTERRYDPFDPSQTFSVTTGVRDRALCLHAAFIRAQTRTFVSRIRSELLAQAPQVTLETNAEADGFQVRVKRVSSKIVRYKIPGSRSQGTAQLGEATCGYWYFLHACDDEPWDGDNLDDYF